MAEIQLSLSQCQCTACVSARKEAHFETDAGDFSPGAKLDEPWMKRRKAAQKQSKEKEQKYTTSQISVKRDDDE